MEKGELFFLISLQRLLTKPIPSIFDVDERDKVMVAPLITQQNKYKQVILAYT